MKKIMCHKSNPPHMDRYECSKCGRRHGMIWPSLSGYESSKGKVMAKFCDNCGHEFEHDPEVDMSYTIEQWNKDIVDDFDNLVKELESADLSGYHREQGIARIDLSDNCM